MKKLFTELLPIFLENRGELFKFYEMTYGEILLVIEANRSRVKQEYQMQANIAYQTSKLNSFAFNDPSAMPSIKKIFPGLFGDENEEVDKKPKQQDWEAMKNNLSIYADMHNAKKERGEA